jgi:hypothetical protein
MTDAFILNNSVSLASDLIYNNASIVEDYLQEMMDRNDFCESIEGLNQAGFKLIFVNQIRNGEMKPIFIKSSHPYDHRTDAVIVYYDKERSSPYLLIVVEFEYLPLESLNEEARQTKEARSKHEIFEQEKEKILSLSPDQMKDIKVHHPTPSNPHNDDEGNQDTALSDKVSTDPENTIEDVLIKNKKKLLEDSVRDIRKNGFKFLCPIAKQEITLFCAICAVVCGVGNRIMYEVYDPVDEQINV